MGTFNNTGTSVPVNEIMTCEVCGVVVPIAKTHSLIVTYGMPGVGLSPYQCRATQHFACSHEHALLAHLQCLFTHIENGDHEGKIGVYVDSVLQNVVTSIKGKNLG